MTFHTQTAPHQTLFMKIFPFCALFFASFSSPLFAQNAPAKPKLVVGIVVDQMRYDFLYRYQSKYGSGGFKRLLGEGFSCENTHYNYVPTYTAPGHAAIYTGATPALSGIIANEWWDPEWRKHRYVTTDERYKTVGSPTVKVGQHSPSVLLSTTITDELRLSNNFQSKVVGVCLKDRASILPAGHIPNAAYWFDDATGNWITSTYYPDSAGLPKWVLDFNARRLPDTLLSKNWDKLAGGTYQESFADWDKYNDGEYAKYFIGKKMPYDLPDLKKAGGYGLLRFTPFGNTFTLDFAMEAVNRMQLGADDVPDMLCISFSSPDYCGHQFGIHGEETEDTYLRLDRDIARFLDFLDKKLGKDNILVFLTADHGGAETPVHLNDLRIPAGVFPESKLEDVLEKGLAASLGTPANFIHEVGNQQIWLNWDAMADLDIKPDDVASVIIDYLRAQPGVYDAFTREELMMFPAEYPFAPELRRGIHLRRSGDILFQLDPAWHADDKAFGKGGSTHGSPYPYDTHVPLIWYGWKIKPGETFAPVNITDITPTLAAMLRIMEPNGNQGKVIERVVEGN
ncbi:MAG: alkaline phosphatase family protein [Haliscomenobacteraceae bacterium CHB4]|nr:Alkaline phosphatase PafA [Saprospiraceae bacterium]MCE7923353.1 alkaline phosphatase family protein [Haliscomenobacteraceae bacterium CHB4]